MHALCELGQLNRHTRYRPASDQPLPHETLPRSGRVTRWTTCNTPVRIFKDPPPPVPATLHLSARAGPTVHVTGPPCPPKEKEHALCERVS